jgi:tetratricopeptide (TPR) repeat protein
MIMMENEKNRARIETILILMALAGATLAVYWQVQYHDFINYDDPYYVADNNMVRNGLSWEGFRWAFQSTTFSNWHPLTWLSHMLDVQIFGKKPAGHHLTSLFFHLANTLLLFLILKEMTASYWRSALVAAMFALHPLHVESVAWVAERKDVLSAFFWFLTLAVYVNYTKRPAKGKYCALLFCYILGLMAKPMLVTLPFVLVLLDFWPLRRLSLAGTERQPIWPAMWPLLREKAPLFLCSLLSCLITYHAQNKGGAVGSLEIVPITVRIGNAFISYAEYLDKTLWPRDLSVFYPYSDTVLLSKALGAALIVLFISLFALYALRRIPYLFVGWFWYLGTLVPVIGLVQVGVQSSADRYTYLPLIGIFLILVWGVTEMTKRMAHQRMVVSGFILLLLAHWIFTSWNQVSYWKNSISLFEHAISVTRDNAIAHVNLGEALTKAGKNDEAMRHYRETLRINPSSSPALNNLGVLLRKGGQSAEAAQYFRRALQFNPGFAEAHLNLGAQLAEDGTPESRIEAIRHFREALKIDPLSHNAHYNLGLMLLAERRQGDAIAHLESAVRLNQEFGMAHYQLGDIYSRQKLPEKAIFHYREALKTDPQPDIHNNLAGQLLLQGKTAEALVHLEAALRLSPTFSAARYNMGTLLMMEGRMEEARRQFGEALLLNPRDKKVRAAVKKAAAALAAERAKSRK